MDIKHIFNETGVKKIYKLIVVSGQYQGDYIIEKPDGWSSADSVVNIDDELFNVKDFIIGDNEKIRFWQYAMPEAFKLIYNVYQEQRGEAHVIFKWLAVKDGVEYDLLQDNFEINFNKYSFQSGKSMPKIEIELIKSEARNKLANREETTIDLFDTKDLDENVITPVNTFTLGYKKGDKNLSNFYSYDISQPSSTGFNLNDHFLSFKRSDEYEFGDNTNEYAGIRPGVTHPVDQGPFVTTNITLKKIQIEISNMHLKFKKQSAGAPVVKLFAIVIGINYRQIYALEPSVIVVGSPNYSEIKIDYKKYPLIDPENLQPGQSLYFVFNSDTPFSYECLKTNTSIQITTNMESPLVKTTGIRLIEGLKQVVKNYTASSLNVVSKFLGSGGTFFNTSISTGVYLRGLGNLYTAGQKIKTSMKTMLTDGAAKLLTLGFDIIGSDVVVEDLRYFFKDIKSYDLSKKQYLAGYEIEPDKDVTFNSLLFGSKKYSTKIKDDIRNFITTAEFSTPITTVKNKFDKQTDLIIDEYKIQELIEDKSSSTNDNDDDLVMIDMVELVDYWDTGVFENTFHSEDGGNLLLTCNVTPFDTTMIQVGTEVQITEGINAGTWTVLDVSGNKIKLSMNFGITAGTSDTPIKYKISSLIKNRSLNDGFSAPAFIRNPETATNARHNPKYHMARWFPFFGSGLTKKKETDLIKVTNYKNEAKASMWARTQDLAYELSGPIVVGADEPIGRLRANSQTLFDGQTIKISYHNVTFEEFITLYENWRYGIGGDRMKSRGYISLNSPVGLLDVYPFGDGALSHSRKNNVLTIKGKVKGRSVEDPVLLSVIQINKNTLTVNFDYTADYVNPGIDIQMSVDGENWTTIHTAYNTKTVTFSEDLLLNFLTGNIVKFRIMVTTPEFYGRISNVLDIGWQFNDYRITEVRRTENIDCGYSELVFDIEGTASLDVEWTFNSSPGGGNSTCLDYNGLELVSFDSLYGPDFTEVKNTPLTVANEIKRFEIRVRNTDNFAFNPLNCQNTGTNSIVVIADVQAKFNNTVTAEERILFIQATTIKYY
ncbi:hypothetical protein [Chryseobacterium vrystaatense]|uniref:Uncharacterized protein n=1 Tax=Chryseobacterium vrystaatense TaxID=307480 RepID=A0A1M4ZLB6_9FLAO|nr:hypothetical protein [Chryseobacterium vrystaatense]SHF18833.1 hypothetical protein SAMN02787073_1634 [Chryseobacterium vrystaatense]